MTQAALFLAFVAILVFGYHSFLLQIMLKRLIQKREETDSTLQQMRENSARVQAQSLESIAATRQFQEDSRADTLRARQDNVHRAEEQVKRMEELLQLQREQVAILRQIAER